MTGLYTFSLSLCVYVYIDSIHLLHPNLYFGQWYDTGMMRIAPPQRYPTFIRMTV